MAIHWGILSPSNAYRHQALKRELTCTGGCAFEPRSLRTPASFIFALISSVPSPVGLYRVVLALRLITGKINIDIWTELYNMAQKTTRLDNFLLDPDTRFVIFSRLLPSLTRLTASGYIIRPLACGPTLHFQHDCRDNWWNQQSGLLYCIWLWIRRCFIFRVQHHFQDNFEAHFSFWEFHSFWVGLRGCQ
jgi:hypothetical protein